MAKMTADELKRLVLSRGWTEKEADFLVNGPTNSNIRGMAILGQEQPQYLEIARKQVNELMDRRANQAGGFLDSVLKRLGI